MKTQILSLPLANGEKEFRIVFQRIRNTSAVELRAYVVAIKDGYERLSANGTISLMATELPIKRFTQNSFDKLSALLPQSLGSEPVSTKAEEIESSLKLLFQNSQLASDEQSLVLDEVHNFFAI